MHEKRLDDMKRSNSENDLISLMYRGTTTPQEIQWEHLQWVPLMSLITSSDIAYLKKLITSPRYSGNSKAKMAKIDELMHYRGFTKLAGGTNRIVYIHPNAPNNVFKVAIDIVGIKDNPAEYQNQYLLKPYCCRVFECSPCGTIASFEKVDRITTFDEFYSIAEDYYYMMTQVILGKYVMDDIGIDYFMNIGIRKGFGVVLLDFPYLYELDGSKLHCNKVLDNNIICNGEIDYDAGFNNLVCSKCGKTYNASELAKPASNQRGSFVFKKGGLHMKFIVNFNDNTSPVEIDTLTNSKTPINASFNSSPTQTTTRITNIPNVIVANRPSQELQSSTSVSSSTSSLSTSSLPNSLLDQYTIDYLKNAVAFFEQHRKSANVLSPDGSDNDSDSKLLETDMEEAYQAMNEEYEKGASIYPFQDRIDGELTVEFVKKLPNIGRSKFNVVYLLSSEDMNIGQYRDQHPIKYAEDIDEKKFQIYVLGYTRKFIRYTVDKDQDGKSYLKAVISDIS